MRGAGAFVALAVWTSVAIHGSDPQQAAQPEAQTTLREFVPLAHSPASCLFRFTEFGLRV